MKRFNNKKWNLRDNLLRKKIHKEVNKIKLNDIKNRQWLDEVTWIASEVNCNEKLKKLFLNFFDFKENENYTYWFTIEYWKDEKSIHYLLQCDKETINIGTFIQCKYLDNLVLQAVGNIN